jgi:hypothetical protein
MTARRHRHYRSTGNSFPGASTLLRAKCSDGADHRGAASKSPLRSLPALARLAVGRGRRVMNTVVMVVAQVITHEPGQMSFVQRDDVISRGLR